MKKIDPRIKENLSHHEEAIAEKKRALIRGLPHLYEKGWYQWAWDFFKSTNKMNLLVAGNQLSKSSTQIRKAIEWCGNPSLWPTLWKPEHCPPRQMWYLYPSQDVAKSEFDLKWVPEFLPRGEYINHPTYGWKVIRGNQRSIESIVFNSGVTLQFKTYMQNPQTLQTSSCHAMFTDEELPEHLYDELRMRLAAVEGYFHMVFTATLNQDFWRMAIEGKGDMEKFPDAFKQQISMRDCITYRDGSPGNFTEEKIKNIEAGCRNENERQRRVEGKFVAEGGRTYPHFNATRHYKKPFIIPADWKKYCGVDLGSGGSAHPPAITFVAVKPDYRMGVVYKGWRGDDGPTYTCGDVFNKFLDLRGKDILTRQVFDFQAKDFGTIAQRAGSPFEPADKSQEKGIDIVNTLFKNDLMFIFDTEELTKLGGELTSLMAKVEKRHRVNDFADSFRYCCSAIPWDWSFLQGDLTEEQITARDTRPYTEEERKLMEIQERRGEMEPRKVGADWGELDEEFEFWNQAAGGN